MKILCLIPYLKESVSGSNADVNKDGEVNVKDVVLLSRYLAGGWNVILI